MQSLLQGLPLEAQQRSFVEPSQFSQLSGNISAIQDAIDLFTRGGGSPNPRVDEDIDYAANLPDTV